MKKYCDYYITTKRVSKVDATGKIIYEYAWYIRDAKGKQLQSSYDNEDKDFETFVSKEIAEQEAKDAIQYYYV